MADAGQLGWSRFVGFDARMGAIAVGAATLLTVIGSGSQTVSLVPVAFAATLTAGDTAWSLKNGRRLFGEATELITTPPEPVPSLELRLRSPVVSANAVTSTGGIVPLEVSKARKGGSVAALDGPPPQPLELMAIELGVRTQLLGLTAIDRSHTLPWWACAGELSEPKTPRSHSPALDRVRPYLVGDPRNHVDWKATARTGELHVRASVQAEDTDLVIVVELRDGLDADQHTETLDAARRAVLGALQHDRPVRLVTFGATQEALQSVLSSSQREEASLEDLAAAVAAIPSGVVDRIVDDAGTAVRRLARCREGRVPSIEPDELRFT